MMNLKQKNNIYPMNHDFTPMYHKLRVVYYTTYNEKEKNQRTRMNHMIYFQLFNDCVTNSLDD